MNEFINEELIGCPQYAAKKESQHKEFIRMVHYPVEAGSIQ